MYSARLTVFAAIAAVILLALPAANLASRAYIGGALMPENPRDLWSVDRIEGNLSYLAMTCCQRSLFPRRVQIGRDGYLFLGDDDGAAMSKTAGTWPVPGGLIAAQAEALANLRRRTAEAGAQFLAVIAPNKHSVYPGALPAGITPAARTVTDDLIAAAAADGTPVLDLRPVLREVAGSAQAYLRTDTHWTRAGAAASYAAIMNALGAQAVPYDLVPLRAPAGDLARLLKMQGLYRPGHEVDYRIDLRAPQATCAAKISLLSGDEGPCEDIAGGETSVMDKALRVTRTPAAPSARTVLMLCDSFCAASSPLFNASFAEIWHVHWKFIDDRALQRYLRALAPDIVILQMVERDALSLDLGR